MDHVLYFVCSPAVGAVRAAETALEATVRKLAPARARSVRFHLDSSMPRALAKLRSRGAEAMVIDARGEVGPLEESTALRLLDTLFGHHDLGGPVGREQTWLVVDSDARGAVLAFEA